MQNKVVRFSSLLPNLFFKKGANRALLLYFYQIIKYTAMNKYFNTMILFCSSSDNKKAPLGAMLFAYTCRKCVKPC